MTQRTRAKGNSSSEVNHRKFECNYKELQAYSDAWSHKIFKAQKKISFLHQLKTQTKFIQFLYNLYFDRQ
jgi:hypothetical protein